MLGLSSNLGAAILAALIFAGAGYAFLHTRDTQPAFQSNRQFERGTLELVTQSGSKTIDIELAQTPAQQAQGLMYRTKLNDTSGMLFPHPKPSELRMWMRNTYIPLDMVFIRADGTVHRIAAMTEPHSEDIVASKGLVTAVLELNGGAAARLGLNVGDKVRHKHFGTAP